MEGKLFKLARILDGKRQSEVALQAKIPVSVLSQFENGWRILRPEQLTRLEKVLPALQKAKTLLD